VYSEREGAGVTEHEVSSECEYAGEREIEAQSEVSLDRVQESDGVLVGSW